MREELRVWEGRRRVWGSGGGGGEERRGEEGREEGKGRINRL